MSPDEASRAAPTVAAPATASGPPTADRSASLARSPAAAPSALVAPAAVAAAAPARAAVPSTVLLPPGPARIVHPGGVPGAVPADPGDALAGTHWTIVPHTHWDREWYLPFEVMRVRLARAVERVCDVLETDERFRAFTLDGQAVILEDVVELRPALEPRLRALLAAGRLVTGPSYVLPDEFLAGPEALVRNLLIGRATCAAFGAEPMGVGYLPDTFGHVAQLPQILRGFGLDSFVFWRGLGDEADRLGTAFTWAAPDGSAVTAIRQLGSYGNANQLGRWLGGGVDLADQPERYPDAAAARFTRFVTTYAAELARTPTLEHFLCNGSDHEEIHAALPDLLDHVRAAHPSMSVAIGSYETFWHRLAPTLEAADPPTVTGELVGGRDAPVLRGIDSARMELKLTAERVDRALAVAETMAALVHLRDGTPPPLASLRRAWREHLRNLPHDSISGCSTDEVHRDMAGRWSAARQLADHLRDEGLAALASGPIGWTRPAPATSVLAAVNPLAAPRDVVVTVDVPPRLRGRPVAVEVDGLPVPAQATGPGQVLVPLALAGFGVARIELVAAPATPGVGGPAVARVLGPATVGNGLLTVRADTDGTVEVVDLRNGARYPGLHRLEDVADRGDEYDFCPVEGDVPVGVCRPATVRATMDGPLVAELRIEALIDLPRRLAPDRSRRVGRVAIPVRTVVRLTAGSDRVEFRTELENRARDHRLRVRFPAPGASDATLVRAEGHFAMVHRPPRPVWRGFGWAEPPALTGHTVGAVAAGDLAVVTRGLPEYEAVPVGGGLELAVTLLRAVGWLSRDDLATRPGHAGPAIPTPEAQGQGPWTFEYAVLPGAADRTDADLARASMEYRTPVVLGPGPATADPAARRPVPLLSVRGEAVASALKPAEDGRGAILRLVAYDTAPVPIGLDWDGVVGLARLDETPLAGDPLSPMRPGEIRTLRLTRD